MEATTFTNKNNNFQEFNQFQTYFYTNVERFNMYSNFEIRRNSVQLLVNISKGFPLLSQEILNIYSKFGPKAVESPAIIKALQQAKFVNGFSRPKVPQYIYFKNAKVVKSKEPKVKVIKNKSKNKTKKYVEFEPEIIDQIQSILFFDEKDYQDFKHTDKVQTLGLNLITNK